MSASCQRNRTAIDIVLLTTEAGSYEKLLYWKAQLERTSIFAQFISQTNLNVSAN